MKVDGIPVVGIQIGAKRLIEVPTQLDRAARVIETEVIPPLAPFVLP